MYVYCTCVCICTCSLKCAEADKIGSVKDNGVLYVHTYILCICVCCVSTYVRMYSIGICTYYIPTYLHCVCCVCMHMYRQVCVCFAVACVCVWSVCTSLCWVL